MRTATMADRTTPKFPCRRFRARIGFFSSSRSNRCARPLPWCPVPAAEADRFSSRPHRCRTRTGHRRDNEGNSATSATRWQALCGRDQRRVYRPPESGQRRPPPDSAPRQCGGSGLVSGASQYRFRRCGCLVAGPHQYGASGSDVDYEPDPILPDVRWNNDSIPVRSRVPGTSGYPEISVPAV